MGKGWALPWVTSTDSAAAAGNGASADGAAEATEEAEEDVVDAEVVDEGQ